MLVFDMLVKENGGPCQAEPTLIALVAVPQLRNKLSAVQDIASTIFFGARWASWLLVATFAAVGSSAMRVRCYNSHRCEPGSVPGTFQMGNPGSKLFGNTLHYLATTFVGCKQTYTIDEKSLSCGLTFATLPTISLCL